MYLIYAQTVTWIGLVPPERGSHSALDLTAIKHPRACQRPGVRPGLPLRAQRNLVQETYNVGAPFSEQQLLFRLHRESQRLRGV